MQWLAWRPSFVALHNTAVPIQALLKERHGGDHGFPKDLAHLGD